MMQSLQALFVLQAQSTEEIMYPLIVIQAATGVWIYRGSIPRVLGTEAPATCEDIMAGRSYTNQAGKSVVTKFPVFASKQDALDHAFHNGHIITEQ